MIQITRHMTRDWGVEDDFDRWVAAVTKSEKAFRQIDLVGEGEVDIHWNGCACSGKSVERWMTLTMPPIPPEIMARMFAPDEPEDPPSAEELGVYG